jgi:HTH-type transcriptional regulator / antitoxin HigA
MDNETRPTYTPKIVPHPGETVVDYLDFNGWSQRELARRTGLTPKTISEICSGKAPITPATSLALEKVFQRPAHLWLNLQREFDEASARQRARAHMSSHWTEWSARFPLAEMRRYGWIQSKADLTDAEALLTFFAVSSPDSWASVWNTTGVAYRQTRHAPVSPPAVFAWVRAIEIGAMSMKLAAFDEDRVRSAIPALRRCTRMPVDRIMEPVQELCAAAGIAVVWERELKQTAISGCARWLPGGRALIGLTLRYKTDDQMWFTFFHELAHILLHRKIQPFILDNAEESLSDQVVDPEMRHLEEEANRFAADTLIPPEKLSPFIRSNKFGNEEIHDFAESVGVGPGILVGRLQFEGLLARHQGNMLKQKLGWREGGDE